MNTLTINEVMMADDIIENVRELGHRAIPIEIMDMENQKGICDRVRNQLIELRVESKDAQLVTQIDDLLRARMMDPNFYA